MTEGNSVTLKTGATEIQREDEVLWTFGPQDMVIAQIHKKPGNISYADDERFSDKLQLDQQTGDLTISDIRIRISGDYQMQITGSRAKTKRFKVIVRGVWVYYFKHLTVLSVNVLICSFYTSLRSTV